MRNLLHPAVLAGILLPIAALAEPQPVEGLRARGAFLVDIHWKNGVLLKAAVTSTAGGRCKIRYGERMIEFDTVAKGTYALDAALKMTAN